MEGITKLRQTCSVEDYMAKFEAVSNRLSGLPDQYKPSYFLSDLRDEIFLPVRMFNPFDILIAYSLAKLQKENLSLTKKFPRNGPYSQTTYTLSSIDLEK